MVLTPKSRELDELQVILHELLSTFLSFSSIGLTSLLKRPRHVSYRVERKITKGKKIIQAVGCTDKYILDAWNVCSKESPNITSVQLACIIAYGYKLLNYHFKQPTDKHKVLFPKSDISSSCWREWLVADSRLSNVADFCKSVDLHAQSTGIKQVWVHGSLATMDWIPGYSDFDALIVIDENTCQSIAKLLALQEYVAELSICLYLHDPLQHHGLFVLSEIDFYSYPQCFFPFELFHNGAEVFNDDTMKSIYIRDDFKERKNAFLSAINTIKYLIHDKNDLKYAYDLKAVLQTVVLLPALYLQLKNNQYYYKKNTFSLAKKDFTENEWQIIGDVTRLRIHWSYKSNLSYRVQRLTGRVFNPKFLSTYHRAMSRLDKNSVINIVGNDYRKKCLSLILAMENKLGSLLAGD